MELKDLVGMHELSGVDRGSILATEKYDEDASSLTFVLDGITYTATEDPCDGYRSSMDTLEQNATEVKNRFAPQRVICSMEDPGSYGSDVLQMADAVTGLVVLRVGTDDSCDYYPYFVDEFNPQNMACNAADTEGEQPSKGG